MVKQLGHDTIILQIKAIDITDILFLNKILQKFKVNRFSKRIIVPHKMRSLFPNIKVDLSLRNQSVHVKQYDNQVSVGDGHVNPLCSLRLPLP